MIAERVRVRRRFGLARAAIAVAAGILGLSFLHQGYGREADGPTAPAWRPPHGTRVVYPPGTARLALPGGDRRTIRSLLDIERPLQFGDYVWDERGALPGRPWIRIDLALQTISVFRGGDEIGSALVLFGADGKPTPPGLYPILRKAKQHRSSLYDAEMPFMLQLTYDGVAIHASSVRARAATHGCIGVPIAFARKMFEEVKPGDLVAILPTSSAPAKTI